MVSIFTDLIIHCHLFFRNLFVYSSPSSHIEREGRVSKPISLLDYLSFVPMAYIRISLTYSNPVSFLSTNDLVNAVGLHFILLQLVLFYKITIQFGRKFWPVSPQAASRSAGHPDFREHYFILSWYWRSAGFFWDRGLGHGPLSDWDLVAIQQDPRPLWRSPASSSEASTTESGAGIDIIENIRHSRRQRAGLPSLGGWIAEIFLNCPQSGIASMGAARYPVRHLKQRQVRRSDDLSLCKFHIVDSFPEFVPCFIDTHTASVYK